MFKRNDLRYNFKDLDPYIDALTMETHYEKHYKGYTDKFNDAISTVDSLNNMSAEDIMRNISLVPFEKKDAVINNGGGYLNHLLYFDNIIPNGMKPSDDFLNVIENEFESFDNLIAELKLSANKMFGSGWTFLVIENGKLKVINRKNQDSPYLDKLIPILAIDLWEHAYYLNYKNLRAEYIDNFFKIVNWDFVSKKYFENI